MDTNEVMESVKKKNKADVKIKSKQVNDYLWMFVHCLIENPTFDSQTKENLTLPYTKKFVSTCELSDKFYSEYNKKYETVDDPKTLRYGRLMIMTDQGSDGFHTKGLLINFIHHN